ncbi:MAG TPA: glycosyltransferase family 2 protein, partial [Acidimicrobiia bacterium]|nr:glycosyltransferase family 2 protein [Acidimicrobiia bacterium]
MTGVLTLRVPAAAITRTVDVSVLTPVLNEERFIRDVVASMRRQRFDGEIEFLFADGGSTDRTREILAQLAHEDRRIRVFHNEARTIPAGLNLLLRHARGRYVARMDGHAFYPADYLARAVERLERGDTHWVSGPQVPVGIDAGSRRTAMALSSRLGVGGSRRFVAAVTNGAAGEACDEVELDSGVFCGVWTRAVVDDLGGWDEGWPRNQDSEMAGRFLERGLRLVCLPDLGAEYVPRSSLRALARQYAGYGYYRAKTAARHPRTLRRSHLLAPAVVGMAAAAAPRRAHDRMGRG